MRNNNTHTQERVGWWKGWKPFLSTTQKSQIQDHSAASLVLMILAQLAMLTLLDREHYSTIGGSRLTVQARSRTHTICFTGSRIHQTLGQRSKTSFQSASIMFLFCVHKVPDTRCVLAWNSPSTPICGFFIGMITPISCCLGFSQEFHWHQRIKIGPTGQPQTQLQRLGA
jgi:hypothetical protein